jgi:glutathione synthase/RimK-type ligase-like ATP-grasp enzyme
LSFGAIDIIKKLNGEYVFLEINPNGQWAWLETELDLKISDEIINYLTLK